MLTLIEKYIIECANPEDFKKAVATYLLKNADDEGRISKECLISLAQDCIQWGMDYCNYKPTPDVIEKYKAIEKRVQERAIKK